MELNYLSTIFRLKLAISFSDWKCISDPNRIVLFPAMYFTLIKVIVSLYKPYLFTAPHSHAYNSILTDYTDHPLLQEAGFLELPQFLKQVALEPLDRDIVC